MGRQDIATRRFFENNRYFADAVNGYLYQGKQVIAPEDLHEADVTETIAGRKNTRDLMRSVVIRETDNTYFALIGIENQTKIDYSLPIRIMRADMMRYDGQIRRFRQLHVDNGDFEVGSDEHFSGIGREDRLRPVVTIVVYWGSRPWTGPRCLRDMLEMGQDTVLGNCVSDYKLHIIDAHSMNDAQMDMYGEDLGFILRLVRESADSKGLRSFMSSSTYVLDKEEAICVAEQVIGRRLPRKRKEGDRMCDAFQTILKEERDAGIELGTEQGIEKGFEQGIEQGVEKGMAEGIEKGRTSMVEAMRKNGMSEEQIDAVLKSAGFMIVG